MPHFIAPTPRLALLAAVLALTACVSMEAPAGPPRKQTVFAATATGELLRFNAGQPSRVLARVTVSGLDSGDHLVGIDFRVARGVLYALSARGRLYTLDTTSGKLTAVGPGLALDAADQAVGFDFNPVADRIRVVTAGGRNLRLHPDSGALAAEDPALRYADGDTAAAAFDIADVDNTALAALRHGGATRLHLIDLASGRATALGRVADGQALAGLAIEP